MPDATRKRKLSKAEYEKRLPRLRADLVQAQVELKSAPFPVILIVAGVDGAGKGDLVNELNAWLDPRGVETHAFDEPSDEERERPPFYRYWRCLPPRGRIAIFFNSWYTEALLQEAYGRAEMSRLDHTLDRIAFFEKMLLDDGALIIKCWLHLSKKDQRDRFQKLEADPETRWRVSATDWRHQRMYDKLARLSRRILRHTHQPAAPWHLVPSADPRYRDLCVGEHIVRRLRAHLKARAVRTARSRPPARKKSGRLAALPMDGRVSAAEYDKKKNKLLGKLHGLFWKAEKARRSVIFVFEGWDAAGKGGAIRRLTSAIDARFFRVIPVGPPAHEEKTRHYLWRFWRHLPRAGKITIFDRSWYGRVLVERVEGFAREEEWRRAYEEINHFEKELIEHGVVLIKFWMHVTPDEQLRRFRDREKTPYKRHKITGEDWRNREKWAAYEAAVEEMIDRTGTPAAPWALIPADDKRHARLRVLKIACERLAQAVGPYAPAAPPNKKRRR